MPDKNGQLLPPLPDTAYDGERFSKTLTKEKCLHTGVSFKEGELRCSCGAAWQGANLYQLYEALSKRT